MRRLPMNPSVRKEIKELCADPLMIYNVHPPGSAKKSAKELHGSAKKLHELMCLLCDDRRKEQQAITEYLCRREKEQKEKDERRQKEIAARRVKKEAARQAKAEKARKRADEEAAVFRRERAGMDEAMLNEQYAAHHLLREEKIARNKEISKKKRSAMNSRDGY